VNFYTKQKSNLTNLTKHNKLTQIVSKLVQKNRDFRKPNNSLDHSVVGKYVINVEMEFKSNVKKKYWNLKFWKSKAANRVFCCQISVGLDLLLNHNNSTTSVFLLALNVATNRATWKTSHFPIILQIPVLSIETAVCGYW